MTRIVAGFLGGRRIAAPPGRSTRPTSDRVREALFSTVDSMVELSGCSFADLYAGSGAVGLEAASRGADQVLLVESDARAARTIRENIALLGVEQICRLVTGKVATVVHGRNSTESGRQARGPADGAGPIPYQVIFMDPPYDTQEEEIISVLAGVVERGWLAEQGLVVVERSTRSPQPIWPARITDGRARRYGETTLWYGRLASK